MASIRYFNDAKTQDFPFKSPLLQYIFDNNKNWLKLYQCCKYFPNKFPLTAIHAITDTSPHFYYNDQPVEPENVSKIWLSNKLEIGYCKPALPKWISKIWICTIKDIDVRDQDLSVAHMKMLAQHGTIKSLQIRNVLDGKGKVLAIEDTVALVPSANEIMLTDPQFTPETFTKLASQIRTSKIKYFGLYNVITEIDPNQLIKFIEAHAESKHSEFNIYFGRQISDQHITTFRSEMKAKIYFNPKFKNFIEKPCFYCSHY